MMESQYNQSYRWYLLVYFRYFCSLTSQMHLQKLRTSESLIIPPYYYFSWGVVVLSLTRVSLMLIPRMGSFGEMVMIFLMSYLFQFIELAVIIFMMHRDPVSGREAIKQTVFISFVISSAFEAIQILLAVLFHTKIWPPDGPERVILAAYWLALHGSVTLMCLVFLVLPHTRLRSLLPPHQSFFLYIGFLFLVHLSFTIGEILILCEFDVGFCFTAVARGLDWGFLCPVIYFCFLHIFFKDIYLPQSLMEMDQQGYLNTDT